MEDGSDAGACTQDLAAHNGRASQYTKVDIYAGRELIIIVVDRIGEEDGMPLRPPLLRQRPGGGGSNGNAPLPPPPPPPVLLDPEPNRSDTATFESRPFAFPGMVMEKVWPSFRE